MDLDLYVASHMSLEEVVENVVDQCDFSQIEEFIYMVDLRVANVGFTDNIIERLLRSLIREYNEGSDEHKTLCETLSCFEKYQGVGL